METNNLVSEDVLARSSAAGKLYLQYYTLLARIAVGRFGLSGDDAENAIQDIFLTFLRTPTKVRDPRAWLVAAMCNACREYWRRGQKFEPSSPNASLQHVEQAILSKQVLARLPSSSQRVLTLHYIEGLTAAEIAVRLKTSLRYAEQLIHRGLYRARRAASG